MDIRDRRLKARLSKWSTCSVETKRGLVKPRKVIMFKRFLSYYEPQMGLFVADTVCALVLAAIDLAFPIILRNLTGGLFTQGQAVIMQALGMIAVGLVLMYAVRCACRYFVSYWGHVMGARMESKMREDLFDQYERFSFAYFDRNSSGDMMSRVVNDLFDICEAAHHVPEWIIICGIEIIGSFVILFTIAPVLALAMAVVTAAFAVIMFWQNMRMREVFSDNRKKISGINAQLQDSLAGMRVVKSFANEETERFKFRASNNRYLSSKENMYHAMGVYTATYGLLSGVLYVIVVLLGGWLVAQGQLQAVDMATFALYISLFCTPLETLVNSAETYQKAIAGFKRMDEVLSTAPDIQDKPGATDLQVTAGAVEYHDVCFNYEDVELGEGDAEERPVIDHMNLSIKPGQTIALVGPSGGGKSTTCSLLPRFYDVAAGSISIDGQDVRDVTQQSLRRAIGLVQQDVYLFDGTIGENIAYGKPGATAEEVAEAARRATSMPLSSRFHRVMTRSWASAAAVFRADRSSVLPSRECFSRTPRSLFWMRRRVLWITRARRRCRSRSKSWHAAAPRLSSPTVFRPLSMPMRSRPLSMVALWSVARTRSFSPVAALMPVTIECSSKVRVRTSSTD